MFTWDKEKAITKEKIKDLNKYFRSILAHKIGQLTLEDVVRAMRLSKAAKPQNEGRFFIVFDVFTDNAVSTYKTYSCIDPVVWYFWNSLDDQPAATINFLHEMFFGYMVKLPTKNEINYLDSAMGHELTIYDK